jgi:methylenetetrahydrofolate--tRNA-(uracil-5-)-methyltransferase
LDRELRLKSKPNIRFAGQITGCEGYVESAAIGLIAARFAAAELRGERLPAPPPETAIGALLAHITGGADADTYQPMNVNFGLMPPPEGRIRKADRKKAYTDRAREKLAEWLASVRHAGSDLGPAFQFQPQQEKADVGSSLG